MSGADGPLVVIGLGNVLLRDDGIGVRIVEALRRRLERDPGALPPGTRLVDGGTLGMGLLEHLDGARAAILVDAVDLGNAPGTVTILRGDAIAATGGLRSGFGSGGLAELLTASRLAGRGTPILALVGVQVDEIRVDLALSPRLEAALPAVIETVRCEACALDALPVVTADLVGATA